MKSYIFSLLTFCLLSVLSLNAQNVSQIEYFIDNDPGFGNATAVTGFGSSTDVTANFNVPLAGISNGVHTLYVRAKDSNNDWSLLQSRAFIKGIANSGSGALPNIVSVEYFIDEDPGFGNGEEVLNSSGTDVTVPFTADLSGLSNGVHTLYVRGQDSNGNWSLLQSRTFIKGVAIGVAGGNPNIERVEYFIDEDPGFGLATTAPFISNPNLTDVFSEFIVDLSDVTNGVHTLYVRAKDDNDNWSLLQSRTFIKGVATGGQGSKSDIDYIEYFIDEDPGFAAGTSVPFSFNPDGTDVIADFTATLTSLDNGVHTLYVRAIDENGNWSLLQSRTFIKMPGVTGSNELPDVTEVEYFIDTDPGLGQALPYLSFMPSPDVCVPFIVDVTGVSLGAHTLYVRALDENGNWSLTASRDFEIINGQTISGTVYDENGVPLNGVEITFGDLGTVTTFSDGTFTYAVPTGWDGSITVNWENYIFADPILDFSTNPVFSDINGLNIVGDREELILNLCLLESIMEVDGTIPVVGSGFTPDNTVSLLIQGGTYTKVYTINTTNTGSFNFSIPYESSMEDGSYTVLAINNGSDENSVNKEFIIEPIVSNNILVFTPSQDLTIYENAIFSIQWTDYLYDLSNYPSSGIFREYKYLLEYQNLAGNWISLATHEGSNLREEQAIMSQEVSLPNAGVNYKIRVIDFYDTSRMGETESFDVEEEGDSNIETELVWDSSMPTPFFTPDPKGVAADGVSRLLIKVNKENLSTGPNIESVTLELNDGVNTTPSQLGKLMPLGASSDYSTYNEEANSAYSLIATQSIPTDDAYYFWYVSPDNFVGQNAGDKKNRSRIVEAFVGVNYENGTYETIPPVQIEIVRPPLMLVHGLGGAPSGWDTFRFMMDGEEFKFNSDNPLYVFTKAPKMYEHRHFDENSQRLLTNEGRKGFAQLLKKMKKQGYAANQVHYVCHSMGGSVIRNTFDKYYGAFVNPATDFKNYGQGYVDRIITLDTPHNGAAIAKWGEHMQPILNSDELLGKLMKSFYQLGGSYFVSTFYEVQNNQLDLSDAVKDLRSGTGVLFGETSIPSHLILGDVIPGAHNITNFEGEDWIGFEKRFNDCFITNISQSALEIIAGYHTYLEPDNYYKLDLALINTTLAKDKIPSRYLDLIFKYYGADPLENSDFVVEVSSQTAGLPRTSKMVSDIPNESIFHAFHRQPQDNMKVGNKVYDLLNQSVSSEFFGSIPANNALGKPAPPIQNNPMKSTDPDVTSRLNNGDFDIVFPTITDTYEIDDTLEVQVIFNDTVDLVSVNFYFQEQFENSREKIDIFEKYFQVSGNYVTNNELLVYGVYDYGDSVRFVYDSVLVNVEYPNIEQFIVNPTSSIIVEEEEIVPDYKAVFPTFVSSIGYANSGITAVVNDPSIVEFNNETKLIKGLSPGETFVVCSFMGLSDTLYIQVEEKLELNIADCSQTIPLNPGWNLVSLDVAPSNKTISAIFGGLQAGNLEFVTGFDNGAKVFNPNDPPFLNTLTQVEDGFGYWVKVQNADVLTVSGPCLDDGFRKPYDAGWNLVAFPPDAQASPAAYFADLITANNLEFVTGFENGALVFNPNDPPFLNTLQQMKNGFGYWVKVVNAISGKNEEGINTSNVFNFYNGITNLKEGEQIQIQDKEGNIFAEMQVLPEGYLMTTAVYGDDPTTEANEGILPNEALVFVWQNQSIDLGTRFKGDLSVEKIALFFEQNKEEEVLPLLSAVEVFPNPAQNQITFDWKAIGSTPYSLEIYDANGRLLIQQDNEQAVENVNLKVHQLPEGIYTYKLLLNEETHTGLFVRKQ